MIDRLKAPSESRRLLSGLLAASVAFLALLAWLDGPLETEPAPRGTISMEFAGDQATAEAIIGSWEAERVIERASFLLGLDYLFAPLYAFSLALLALAAGRAWQGAGRPRIAAAAAALALAALLAWPFDWIENSAMATSYLADPRAPWPTVATIAAVPKFAAVFAALIYAAGAFGASALGRRRGQNGA